MIGGIWFIDTADVSLNVYLTLVVPGLLKNLIRDRHDGIKKPPDILAAFLVTPRRAVMNYLKQARELMPVMMGWNGEVARFLEHPRGVQTLAATY